jgi:hypothetical protein
MKLLWIAGWASDFNLWKNEIEELYDTSNDFMSPHDAIETDFKTYDLIIAWSMGVHLIPQGTSTRVLLINPAIDFCNLKLGIHPRILNRMIKGIDSKKELVLSDFATNCGFAASLKKSWLEKALQINSDQLKNGLEDLKKLAELKFENLAILQSNEDQITPKDLTSLLVENNQISNYKTVSGSHLPDFKVAHDFLSELKWI